MATSQNGWSASPTLPLRPLVVGGVEFVPGIRDDDDVAVVLGYVMGQYHEQVERLYNPGCWGYNYRANANNPNSLSNHSSGTAVDANAPSHPNGVPTGDTFTQAEIDEIHRILGEVDHVIRWGGDYTGTPDAMHFEVNVDKPTLGQVADRLRGQGATDGSEDPMPEYLNVKAGKLTLSGDWQPVEWATVAADTAGGAADPGNPGLIFTGRYVASLIVSADVDGNVYTRTVEGDFNGPGDAWQVVETGTAVEHPHTTGSTNIQDTRVQSMSKGRRLRVQVKGPKGGKVESVACNLVYWPL